MASTNLFEESSSRLLTASALDFVLGLELKRAARAQNVLTIIVIEVTREWEGTLLAADQQTLHELAHLIGKQVRETDLLGRSGEATLSLVLLDTGFEPSTHVIDRFLARIDGYDFAVKLRLVVGAASCPIHSGDPLTLMRYAVSHPIINWT